MEFLERWKKKANETLSAWAKKFKPDSVQGVYGSLVGLTLWPVFMSMQDTGNPLEAGIALAGVAGGVGGSLIANLLQRLRDKSLTQEQFIAEVGPQLEDSQFREAADKILKELDAIAVAQKEISSDLQEEFLQILRRELNRFGNVELIGYGNVNIVANKSKVVANGQLVEGSVGGDVLGPGAKKITHNVQADHRASVEHLRKNYLEWILERDGKLALEGIDPAMASGQQQPMRLNHVYTTLMTMSTDEFRRLQKERDMAEPGRVLAAVEVLQKHRHLVLLGDPGGGKSTFVNHLSMSMAGEILGRSEANLALLSRYLDQGEEKEGKRIVGFTEALLPVKVVLRDYVSRLLEQPGLTLWQFMAESLGEQDLEGYADHLKQALSDSGGLILLDGLDEVPQSKGLREAMIRIVEQFRERFSKCRILVTSRTYAYEKQQWQLPGFSAVVLAPFNHDQIEFFVRRWYEQVAHQRSLTDSERDGRTQRLLLAIENNEKLRELARRPILLTLMAGLHAWRGGTLPDGRQELYRDIFPLLMDRWEQPKFAKDEQGCLKLDEPALTDYLKTDKKELQKMLERMAYDAHASQQDSHGTADISSESLSQALMELCEHCDPEERPDPVELRRYLQNRAGILQERGTGVYAFPHRSFQEYLAACHCTGLEGFTAHMAALARTDPDRWREVCLLAAAEAAGIAGLTWNLVDELFNEKCAKKRKWSVEDHWGLLLAAQVIAESCSLKAPSPANRAKLDRVRKALPCLMASAFPPTERALAGRVLARLGDPRKEIMIPEGMEFKKVSAGSFWMGAAEKDKDAMEWEKPGFENALDEFYMARYPVSNAQYRRFVEDDGYHDERWWNEAIGDQRWDNGKLRVRTYSPKGGKDEGAPGPADYGLPFSFDNHPVVGVSWYEAMAYCRWLTEYLKTAKKTPDNIRSLLKGRWCVTLPSEAEWEKTARGTEDRRIYPWGHEEDADRMNYSATKIGSSSALGCFPKGSSPFKCEDIAGNVWEWCRTPWQESYKDYKNEPAAGGKGPSRVVRGGAFDGDRDSVRCSCRYRDDPSTCSSLRG
jgi:formylglycine-generating enzyme required for sulfatase activity